MLTKNMKFPQNLTVYMEGRPYPCCYDFKWSEITARGDQEARPCQYDLKYTIISIREIKCWCYQAQRKPILVET